MGKKTKALTSSLPGEIVPEEYTYAAKLRAAVYNGVTESDIADVVKKITQQAKAGDEGAVKMLFEYVLGHGVSPPSITVHNHFEDVAQAAKIVKASEAIRDTDCDDEY